MRKLATQIIGLQEELDREIEKRRAAFGVTLHDGLVAFEHGITADHRKLRMKVSRFLADSDARSVLTAPVIYSLILPLAILDVWVCIFQAVCFRAYGIARVRRADYIIFDRQHLAYLNGIEALNCMFCAYGNGVIAYVREVSSRTEQYWCPIKHAFRMSDPHRRYHDFLEYGDADGYRERLAAFREQLKAKD